MARKQNYLLYLFIAAIMGVGFIVLLSLNDLVDRQVQENCETKTSGRYLCYTKQVKEMLETQGVESTLKYLSEVTWRKSSYSVVHVLMHQVGRYAYFAALGDMGKANSYLPTHSYTAGEIRKFDGYRHGLFQSFFGENRKGKPMLGLITEACSEYMAIQDLSSLSDAHQEILANECFHGVGHALMYANENDVPTSLFQCDELPYEWMGIRCQYGVMMENAFLYSPEYYPGSPRPFTGYDNMASLCQQLNESHRGMCSHFVGQAFLFLLANTKNFEGAFSSCNSLDRKNYISSCIERMALLYIPNSFRDDFEGIIETCQMAGADYEIACVKSARNGIALGAAGEANKTRELCNFVEEELRDECLAD